MSACPWAYQANSSNCLGERKKDVYGWVKPFCPSIVVTPGLILPLDLLLKDSKDVAGRVTCLKLRGEWM